MRRYSLENTPFTSVSHNPELKKQVLVPEGTGCVRHISRIVLRPGDNAAGHSHAEFSEVFYCVRGSMEFGIENSGVRIKGGECLIVEPGEEHAITEVFEETELIYMLVGR